MSTLKRLTVPAAILLLATFAAGTAAAQDAVPAEGDEDAKAQLQNREQHRYRHQIRTQAEEGQKAAAQGDGQKQGAESRIRIRARFTDRNGDGVCDQFQAKQVAKKLQKGKTHRNRNREGSMGRGFGRGGHAVPASAH